ncbi:MAG TPA: DUF2279 domain-containing protein [Spirochaetota bacterium]
MRRRVHIKTFACVVVALLFLFGNAVSAEEPAAPVTDSQSSDSGKTIVRNSILIGTAPVIFLFGVKAWDWNGDHSFYSRNEGWFSKDTDYAGADKAGHFFAHYLVQRSLYQVFDWTENGGQMKWVYSVGTTAAIGFLIELGDGFSSKYGFSFQDLVMDYTGILCGVILDRFPVVDGFVGISTTYYPTHAFINRYNRHNAAKASLEFVNDYSGWRTMINLKLAGFERVGVHLPLALRLVQFDIGYDSRGYSNYDRGKYARSKTRNMLFGVSLNSAQLLEESVDSGHRNTLYSVAHKALEYYHVPIEKKEVYDF